MNRRRKLIITLGTGALTAPFGAFAQQSKAPEKIWRVGFLGPRKRPASLDADIIGGFPRGMRERGYVEGKNLVIDWRFADDDLARLSGLAAELVQLKPDVIVTSGSQAISAAQKATSTIPIVMGVVSDPVARRIRSSKKCR